MFEQRQSNKNKIAKNTLFLYIRMLVLMLIGLYTSRIILASLGIEDFGVYNVVGGLVSLFSLLSGSLSAAISRFITFELGRNNQDKLKIIFSSAVTVQIILALIILMLTETVGLWFLNTKMVIAENRIYAAQWVYQLSILTFCVSLISIPYNAIIIAHERMSAFAYIGIIEAVFKLLVAYLITISPIDRLIFYAFLIALISVVLRIIYGIYCKRNFKECTYQFVFDKQILTQMFSFAGWNFIGASSAALRDQGGNIILNLFGGATVNAARGIAMQVNDAVNRFVNSFMTAITPQITKSYASGQRDYMFQLMFQGARFSFFMLFLLSFPILLNTQYILSLWLKTVPEHSVLFVQLILIFSMSEAISNPLITAMLATGKIRDYQIIVGGLQMLNLPISYILLRIGFIPETVLIVAIIISQLCLAARLWMLRKMIGLSARMYLKQVYLNIMVVCFVSLPLPVLMRSYIGTDGFMHFVANSVCCLFCTICSIYFMGLSVTERAFVKQKYKTIYKKQNNDTDC